MARRMTFDRQTAIRSLQRCGFTTVLLVPCFVAVPLADAVSEPWRAIGHEPSWSLSRADGQMTIETDFGAKRLSFPVPPAQPVDNRTVAYSAAVDGAAVRITVKNEICNDSMTGMPRPERVTVTIGERRLEGCGGEPATLLQGGEWYVSELAGHPPLAEPRITVTFASDGRVSGNSSCNRFGADYQLTGEGLRIGKGMSSMMACEPPIMQQEQLFLDLLQSIARFSVADGGALVLQTNDGRRIVMTRPSSTAP